MIRLNGSGLFKLFLMAVGLVGLIQGSIYNPTARVIPMVLASILILLMALLFLQEHVPALGKHLRFIGQRGLFAEEKTKADRPERAAEERQEYKKLFRLLIWLIAFAILLGFVNYLLAVPLFLLLFIKFEGEQGWRNAILVAASMGIFNFVLFDLLLKASF